MSNVRGKKGRRWPLLVVLALAVAIALLWEDAQDFWEDETITHAKLNEVPYVPEFEANNLKKKRRIGLLLFGDGGMGDEMQHEVAGGMWDLCQKRPCSLAVGLGDNIYPDGVTSIDDPQWHTAFESPYRKFIDTTKLEFWMSLGNHDRRSNVDAQLQYTEVSPIWRMPAPDYGIPHLPEWLHIYVLDTTFIAKGADIPNFQADFDKSFAAQLKRAAAYMCKKPGWRILAAHNPLVSNGARKNRFRENNVQEALGEFIRRCDINLVFGGHEHMQQHVEMDGAHYLIQGAASSTRRATKVLQYETAFSRYLGYQEGFAHLLVTPEAIDIRFNDKSGGMLYGHRLEWDEKKRHKKRMKKSERKAES